MKMNREKKFFFSKKSKIIKFGLNGRKKPGKAKNLEKKVLPQQTINVDCFVVVVGRSIWNFVPETAKTDKKKLLNQSIFLFHFSSNFSLFGIIKFILKKMLFN